MFFIIDVRFWGKLNIEGFLGFFENKYEVLIDAYLQRLKVKCVENEAWFRKQSEEFDNFRVTFVTDTH